MRWIDRLFIFCFFFASCIFIAKFCEKQTDTFTLMGITSNRPYDSTFDTKKLTNDEQNELRKAISQPYTYFGRGGQAYVFFSEDGKYVIKFFKQRLFKPSKLLNILPLPKLLHRFRYKRNWKRQDKLKRDFFSYKVSFDELKEQTGIIYSHLNKTHHLKKKLTITDRLHIKHVLDLDMFDFIVQKRAEPVYDHMNKLMAAHDLQSAHNALKSIFSLISIRCEKGFRDRDPNIRTNCGFIENRAIKIDVGRFVKNEAMQTKECHNEELVRICSPFEEWIKANHPQLLQGFQKHFKEALK